MLTCIGIEKLFNTFDYNIELKPEGITILTGPNGYGKTTVLKILDALSMQNPLFFINLPFQRITLKFSDREDILLEKKKNGDLSLKVSSESKSIHWNRSSLQDIAKNKPFLSRVDEGRWIDHRTDEILATEELLQRLTLDFADKSLMMKGQKLNNFPEIYFIREQRLLRPITDDKRRRRHIFDDEKFVSAFGNTIEEYARELRDTIRETLAKSSQIAQELDGSFPRRLFDQQQGIEEDEFNKRFEFIKDTQKNLSYYGLLSIKEDTHPTFKKDNAKALYVYVEDTEEKLKVFAVLLEKLKIFTDILNESRFSFKNIHISKEDGFKFTTDDGSDLALSDLSSGEQQEVVMLYELLFRVKPGTLVLIDEPELSLHVVWQIQFLNDLFKIVALQKIQVIVATHSPQIINNNWDWVVDLGDLQSEETEVIGREAPEKAAWWTWGL